MALEKEKFDPKGVKMAIFSEKSWKTLRSHTPVWTTLKLHKFAQKGCSIEPFL